MTEIIVVADTDAREDANVVWRERVSPGELGSEHFAAQLVERLGWALSDADEIEHPSSGGGKPGLDA
jgi:hypothetical protein